MGKNRKKKKKKPIRIDEWDVCLTWSVAGSIFAKVAGSMSIYQLKKMTRGK